MNTYGSQRYCRRRHGLARLGQWRGCRCHSQSDRRRRRRAARMAVLPLLIIKVPVLCKGYVEATVVVEYVWELDGAMVR